MPWPGVLLNTYNLAHNTNGTKAETPCPSSSDQGLTVPLEPSIQTSIGVTLPRDLASGKLLEAGKSLPLETGTQKGPVSGELLPFPKPLQ